MSINVAIVEDDMQTREGLKSMIETSDELSCCGTFEDAESFCKKFKHLDVHVVLMDINLPGMNGDDCVGDLKQMRPEVMFLMCTNLVDEDKVFNSIKAGATGYLLKNSTPEKIVEGIKEIFLGRAPITPLIAQKIIASFQPTKKEKDRIKSLTDREIEILELFAKGFRYQDVAQKLNLKLETIRSYTATIYEKLNVYNKTEAINKVFRNKFRF